MKKTRVCDLLGIEYPVIQGGMGWVSNAELAAAVSSAGGLGVISPLFGPEGNWLDYERREIRKARNLTDKPFGINIGLEVALAKERIDVALEEGVKIITTAAGSPALYTRYLKEAGVAVVHIVFSVAHARKAEAEGVDAVIASGYDGGGLLSRDELPTMVLVPQVADAVEIPVIAAGGIADARGAVAAFALGAEGIQMGTRFLATHECPVDTNYKAAIIAAGDTATTVAGRKGFISARVLKNEFSRRFLQMEDSGASAEEMMEFIGFGRLKLAVEGDVEQGSLMCGSGAGLITELSSAGDVIRSIVEGYERVVGELGSNKED
jgi:enoyl-[acyl-carrier protein] reductase II